MFSRSGFWYFVCEDNAFFYSFQPQTHKIPFKILRTSLQSGKTVYMGQIILELFRAENRVFPVISGKID